MGRLYQKSDELTAEQLAHLAQQKFQEAATIADEKERRSALAAAENLKFKARIKGWLNSDLRAPD